MLSIDLSLPKLTREQREEKRKFDKIQKIRNYLENHCCCDSDEVLDHLRRLIDK